jgi:hypothetical protein
MQRITVGVVGVLLTVTLCGCAHLDFTDFTDGKEGLTYYDPKPYLFVSTTKDCVTTATVVVLPEKKKTVKLKTGYGSADLSVNLSNGMITSVNQKTDTKIPETLGAIVGLGTAVGGIVKIRTEPGKQVICTPSAMLFEIKDGVPDYQNPIKFKVETEIIDLR